MTTNKTYIPPQITIISLSTEMLCSSNIFDYVCTESCKFWHVCQGRKLGKKCFDKEYK